MWAKTVDLTLGYNRVSSTKFIKILCHNFASLLKIHCRELAVNNNFFSRKICDYHTGSPPRKVAPSWGHRYYMN